MIQGTMIAMDILDKHKGGRGGVIVNIASLAGSETFSCFFDKSYPYQSTVGSFC